MTRKVECVHPKEKFRSFCTTAKAPWLALHYKHFWGRATCKVLPPTFRSDSNWHHISPMQIWSTNFHLSFGCNTTVSKWHMHRPIHSSTLRQRTDQVSSVFLIILGDLVIMFWYFAPLQITFLSFNDFQFLHLSEEKVSKQRSVGQFRRQEINQVFLKNSSILATFGHYFSPNLLKVFFGRTVDLGRTIPLSEFSFQLFQICPSTSSGHSLIPIPAPFTCTKSTRLPKQTQYKSIWPWMSTLGLLSFSLLTVSPKQCQTATSYWQSLRKEHLFPKAISLRKKKILAYTRELWCKSACRWLPSCKFRTFEKIQWSC